MDIVLITGFLGAGKTTRIARWLEQADVRDTALIVNEVGQIGLDSILIGQANNAVQMQLLANGCLCCSAGNSPGPVIAQLADAHHERTGRPLQRIVIEASGLARPTQMVRELWRYSPAYANALRVVCVIDVMLNAELRNNGAETFDQLASADYIMLARQDLASKAQLAHCRRVIAQTNPLALLIEGHDLGSAIETPRALLLRFDGVIAPTKYTAHEVTVAVFKPRPISAVYLIEWLENLSGVCGQRLLRVKGLVHIEGLRGLVCVQSVGGLISPLQPLMDTALVVDPFLVVIVYQMEADALLSVDPDGCFPLQ